MSHPLSLGLGWSYDDDSIRSMASHMDRALQKINSSQAWSIIWIQILADQIQDRARGEWYEKLFLKDSPDSHFIRIVCLTFNIAGTRHYWRLYHLLLFFLTDVNRLLCPKYVRTEMIRPSAGRQPPPRGYTATSIESPFYSFSLDWRNTQRWALKF